RQENSLLRRQAYKIVTSMVCQQRKYKACSLLQIIENIENSRRYRFRMEPVPSAVLYKKTHCFYARWTEMSYSRQ
ncbi:hypothetical protein C3R19_28330, partial [Blautia producta]